MTQLKTTSGVHCCYDDGYNPQKSFVHMILGGTNLSYVSYRSVIYYNDPEYKELYA